LPDFEQLFHGDGSDRTEELVRIPMGLLFERRTELGRFGPAWTLELVFFVRVIGVGVPERRQSAWYRRIGGQNSLRSDVGKDDVFTLHFDSLLVKLRLESYSRLLKDGGSRIVQRLLDR
jgi:hypothetical protein